MRLDDFLDIAVRETDPDQLWFAATRWLATEGFDKVIHIAAGTGAPVARTTLGDAFEDYYRSEGLDRHDPFATYCLTASGSVATGADHISDYPYLSDDEKHVILSAADAGFRAGFSSVVRRDAQGWEAWNIGSSLPRSDVQAIRREHGRDIRLALLALRGRLGSPVRAPLSARERQCLDLISDGFRIKAIARELGLADVTVELHLRNAREKLGAKTRDQAVKLYQASPRP
ncbi:helix-turn-helix transcriptional regulator [Tropicibacter oceani]|uniref:LuxR C-terminal-related transcriptional regulator n=1 Tax=Tropicibacter oceani TaxID=3058420 RepID=A0ABY8QJE7_9RHOB|nr:LuxR family transcriptional regulator [Tropicibacter oceani]WGW04141.1 LuxR C-terminal-related transcriptional regulator [Tropicibacter oceani]